jgi:phosphoglycolate phosphatase-like HAD superfamily hydrolase
MPRPEKALLFDIDGTLADTDALHLQAFNLVLGPRGHVLDHTRYTRELQVFPPLPSANGFWRMNGRIGNWLSWKRRKPHSVTSSPDRSSRCRD